MQRGNPPAARTSLLPLLALAAIVVPTIALVLGGGLDVGRLEGQREFLLVATARLGFAGPLLYGLLYAAMAALSLPLSAPMSIFAGFLFGRLLGTATVVTGATIGAGLVLLIARTAFGAAWRRRSGPAIRRFEAGFHANAFSYLLTLRLLPIFPFWLINLAAACLGIRLRTFLAATFIGIVPANIVFTSLGAGIGIALERGEQPDVAILLTPQILLPLIALALLAITPVAYRLVTDRLGRRGRAKRGENA
jgi:uncharacterized membrane protein YdjX (TVP38/TMEM64 family)